MAGVDALRAKRTLEDAERQAREKQKDDAEGRRKIVSSLNAARAEQIRDQTHFAAMQVRHTTPVTVLWKVIFNKSQQSASRTSMSNRYRSRKHREICVLLVHGCGYRICACQSVPLYITSNS